METRVGLQGPNWEQLTSLEATNLLVRSLGLVLVGDDRRDVTARLAVALGSGHSRHLDGFLRSADYLENAFRKP